MSKNESVKRSQRRSKAFAVEYFGGKCSICGYNRCISALEFHHKDSDQKENAPSHVIHSWTWEKAKVELDKCILVCSNCHREIHHGLIKLEEYQRYVLPEVTRNCSICKNDFLTKNENQNYCSKRCSSVSQMKVRRPDKEALQRMISEESWVSIGKKFGVSDNAVRKWAKSYGLMSKT